MATDIQVRIQRGDDVTLEVSVLNSDGSAFDLTGADVRLLVKAAKTDADGSAKIDKLINETADPVQGQILAPATNGVCHFFINDDDTNGATPLNLEDDNPPAAYPIGIKIRTAAGKFHTPADGLLYLTREIIGTFAAK